MKKWLITVVFGTMLVLGACGGDGGSDDSSGDDNGGDSVDTEQAESLYKESCASCHGEDLSGGTGPDLTSVGNDMSEDEIETQIEDGGNGMPGDLLEGDDKTTVAKWLADQK